MATEPRVFTIPASAPFLPTLIARADRRPAGARAFRPAAIRWRWRDATLYPADAARLRGSRARRSSTCSSATPRSCRASCRSATSTRTSSPSPKPRRTSAGAALDLPAALGGLERAHAAGATGAANGPRRLEMRGDGEPPLVAQQPGGGARARRRSRAPDRRHDDAAGVVGPARRPGARRSRRILAAHARVPEDRRARTGRRSSPSARHDRAGRAARPADRGRSAAARNAAPAR